MLRPVNVRLPQFAAFFLLTLNNIGALSPVMRALWLVFALFAFATWDVSHDHGAVIGTEALIGNGATVLDGVTVGSRALIAAGATVAPGMQVPDGMMAVGIPAKVVGEVKGMALQWVQHNPQVYRDLARRHAASVCPVTGDH